MASDVCFNKVVIGVVSLTTILSAPPTRYAGAIRTWRSTPTLQYSIHSVRTLITRHEEAREHPEEGWKGERRMGEFLAYVLSVKKTALYL